jgi:hypothetical protein
MGAKSKAKAASGATPIPQGSPTDELTAYCPDLEQWPRSWIYEERDLPHGQQMVECFRPFLRHLVSSGPSRRTLRLHRGVLGGELISKLHEDPRLRKRPTDQIVLAVLDDEGGPLISHGSEDQQRSFDSTCPRFFRFLKERNTEANKLSGYGHVDNARALPAHSLNKKYKSQIKIESARD